MHPSFLISLPDVMKFLILSLVDDWSILYRRKELEVYRTGSSCNKIFVLGGGVSFLCCNRLVARKLFVNSLLPTFVTVSAGRNRWLHAKTTLLVAGWVYSMYQ